MDDKLTTLLKEMLIIFNKEARLVSPQMEGNMCLALDKLGGEWFIRGLAAQGVDGASEIGQNPDAYLATVRDEAGQKQLRTMVEKNGTAVKGMRRRMVSVMRAMRPGDPNLEFTIAKLADNGGIYHILVDRQ
jgi:hypothetical protein